MADLINSRVRRISELERKCRDALQYDSIFKQLSLKKGVYEKICALLDFVGDSESALSSILSAEQRRTIDPYFLAYGILQLMYSRQVAMRDVINTLSLDIPERLGKSELTVARDRVIGHPTTNDKAAHVIVRFTLNENGFEYSSYYMNKTRRGNIVKYDSLMEEHMIAMEAGMRTLYQYIAKVENERRRQMRKSPASKTLHGIAYITQQICAAPFEQRYGVSFDSNAEILLSALNEFRSALLKRHNDEFAAHEVDHVIEGVHMLQSLFPPKDKHYTNRYRIISDGIEVNLKKLIERANEIDELEKSDLD